MRPDAVSTLPDEAVITWSSRLSACQIKSKLLQISVCECAASTLAPGVLSNSREKKTAYDIHSAAICLSKELAQT